MSAFALLAAACAENASPAEAAETAGAAMEWTIDYGASRLGFTATQTGNDFQGRFEKFDAKIIFDPVDLSTASIDVDIDMSSVRTGDRQRDVALPGKEWFDAKAYPIAKFVSANVEETANGEYVAHGALTIREVTKKIDLPFSLEIEGDTARAIGEVELVRTDFGVGQGEFATDEWVGFGVRVQVDITATR
jgi:polyisoprenoid-binding protein YceI